MSIEEVADTLTECGIAYRLAYRNKDKIEAILVPCTPEEWVDMISREGDFLPACCGNISGMRDEIVSALREDGWMDAASLYEFAATARDHDGWDEDNTIGPENAREYIKSADPVIRLIAIWEVIKGHANLDGSVARPLDPEDFEDACHIVSHQAYVVGLIDLFSRGDYGEVVGDDERQRKHASFVRRQHFSSKVSKARTLAQLVPAIRTVHNKIVEQGEPFEGFAIVAPDTGDVYQTRGGFAVYETKDDCEETLKVWSEDGTDHPFEIRPCHVTIEEGIKLL